MENYLFIFCIPGRRSPLSAQVQEEILISIDTDLTLARGLKYQVKQPSYTILGPDTKSQIPSYTILGQGTKLQINSSQFFMILCSRDLPGFLT